MVRSEKSRLCVLHHQAKIRKYRSDLSSGINQLDMLPKCSDCCSTACDAAFTP